MLFIRSLIFELKVVHDYNSIEIYSAQRSVIPLQASDNAWVSINGGLLYTMRLYS